MRVLHDLCLVGLELGLQRFLERDRLGRDHVHQRAALDAGEDDRLQLLLDLFAGVLRHDDAAARAAQGLVGGRGDDVRVRQRARIHAGGDQAGDVRHVDEDRYAPTDVGDLRASAPSRAPASRR